MALVDRVHLNRLPHLIIATLNGLCANGVLIPMQCEYYALEGLFDP